MRRRAAGLVLAGLLAAGCGVRAEDAPEILRSPPSPPTATPSAGEDTSPSSTPSLSPSEPGPVPRIPAGPRRTRTPTAPAATPTP